MDMTQQHNLVKQAIQQAQQALNTGDKTAALEILERALKQSPQSEAVLGLIGIMHHMMDAPEKAVTFFEKALTVNPQSKDAYFNLVTTALNIDNLRSKRMTTSQALFERAPPVLHRLQIEVTSWCNLKCVGCPRTIAIENDDWDNIHMPMERFEKIVKHMPPSAFLCMQGIGESTLHPDFLKMVGFAKKSRKYRDLTMNTNALTRPISFYKKLKEAGLNHISVSVDSFDPDVAESCRSGTKTDKLKQRLSALVELYAPTPLTVSIVISLRNLHDVPNTLDILNSIGKMYVEVQSLIIYDEDKGESGNVPYRISEIEWQSLQSILQDENRFPNLQFIGESQNTEQQTTPMRCSRPFLAPYITAQGYLTPCCTCEDPSVLGYANAAEHSFTDLWQSDPVQTFIRNYVTDAHAICEGCCFWTG